MLNSETAKHRICTIATNKPLRLKSAAFLHYTEGITRTIASRSHTQIRPVKRAIVTSTCLCILFVHVATCTYV